MKTGMSKQKMLLRGLIPAVFVLAIAAGGWGLLPPQLPKLGKVPDFQFTDSRGNAIGRKNLLGSVWIASFITSHCHASCPRQTAFLAQIRAMERDKADFNLVAFTMDPKNDTALALDQFAAKHDAQAENWHFVTGAKPDLYRLAFRGFNITGEKHAASELPEFIHTSRMALVDRKGEIRGYYDSESIADREKLEKDLKRFW
jgi:protein SCO1